MGTPLSGRLANTPAKPRHPCASLTGLQHMPRIDDVGVDQQLDVGGVKQGFDGHESAW